LLNDLAKSIRSRSKPVTLATSLLLVLALGVVDLMSGAELSFFPFYLIPIILVTWHCDILPGIGIATASAVVWLLSDLLAGHLYSHPLIPYWNMATRLGFFLLTVYLLTEVKSMGERRRILERIFFHDILNVATGIRGFAEILRTGGSDREELANCIYSAAQQMIGEIEAQRDVTAAEQQELRPQPGPVDSRQLMEQVADWYRHRTAASGKNIVLAPDLAEVVFVSDPTLLSRILGNMLKNALEAARPGETVTAGCHLKGEMVEFWVHNPEFIPLRDQTRVFHRSFSTKGRDRGLGTYSMKLLGESLGGEISFTSSQSDGTTFRARFPRAFPKSSP